MVDPVPAGLDGRIIPYLLIDGAAAAIDFYVAAFGAEEEGRLAMPDGTIGHASIRVFGATVFLADAPEDMPGDAKSPTAAGGTTVLLHQYVPDVDAAVARAEAAGGNGPAPAGGPVLRRPRFGGRRSVRPPVGVAHPHPGRQPRGDGAGRPADELTTCVSRARRIITRSAASRTRSSA